MLNKQRISGGDFSKRSETEDAVSPQDTAEARRQQPQDDPQDARAVDTESVSSGEEWRRQMVPQQAQCREDQAAASSESIRCDQHLHSSTGIENAVQQDVVHGKNDDGQLRLPRISECFEIRQLPLELDCKLSLFGQKSKGIRRHFALPMFGLPRIKHVFHFVKNDQSFVNVRRS